MTEARRPRPRPRTRWQVFKDWNHDEKFWKDVYSRTVSTAIVAVLAFIAAVAGGYVHPHRHGVAIALTVVGFVLTPLLSTARILRAHRRHRDHPSELMHLWFLVSSAVLVFGVIALIDVFWLKASPLTHGR